ncbi:unnamed protein product, partial [Prorocentrum cordatum]
VVAMKVMGVPAATATSTVAMNLGVVTAVGVLSAGLTPTDVDLGMLIVTTAASVTPRTSVTTTVTPVIYVTFGSAASTVTIVTTVMHHTTAALTVTPAAVAQIEVIVTVARVLADVQRLREELAAADPEFKAALKDKEDRKEEMQLRKQGEYVAMAMKSSFGDQLTKLLEALDSGGKPKKSVMGEREVSPTPVAEAPVSTALLKRAEIGWPRSLIGGKKQLGTRMSWAEAAQVLEARMVDKTVVAQINKCIMAHFPKRTPPTSKAKRVQLVLGILHASAL